MNENDTSLKEMAVSAANGGIMAPNLRGMVDELAENANSEFVPDTVRTPVPVAAKIDAPKQTTHSATVITAPPKPSNTPMTTNDGENIRRLMDTPAPPPRQPVPSTVGLSPEALETPVSPMAPGVDKVVVGLDKLSTVMFITDDRNSLTDQQMEFLDTILVDVPREDYFDLVAPVYNWVTTQYDKMRSDRLKKGVATDERDNALYDNAIANLRNLNEQYKERATAEEDPQEVAAIVIDKKSQNVSELGLTKEEHGKLEKVNKVKLILMEDMDLAHIEIEKPEREFKADYVRSIEGSMSRYGVPLPIYGDFVNFKGAQTGRLVNTLKFEDVSLLEATQHKAELIYDRLIGGAIMRKYDGQGKSVLTYNQFLNIFPYQDIEIGLYGVLCASYAETATAPRTCKHCGHTWELTYNIKNLLKMDDIGDDMTNRINLILKYKNNSVQLADLHTSGRKVHRYMSPFTKNIYDLRNPSTAKAIEILKRVDIDDPMDQYISSVALFLDTLYVYNGDNGKYIPVGGDELNDSMDAEIDLLIETVRSLANEDMTMLAQVISELYRYEVKFQLKATCPECNADATDDLNIDSLIFLRAQDSITEIES